MKPGEPYVGARVKIKREGSYYTVTEITKTGFKCIWHDGDIDSYQTHSFLTHHEEPYYTSTDILKAIKAYENTH